MYEIKSGIEIPKAEHRGRACKYPWDSMMVGQSFEAPISESTKISSAVARVNIRRPSCRFILRCIKSEGIVRVWRVK